jgi:hypothetical protein
MYGEPHAFTPFPINPKPSSLRAPPPFVVVETTSRETRDLRRTLAPPKDAPSLFAPIPEHFAYIDYYTNLAVSFEITSLFILSLVHLENYFVFHPLIITQKLCVAYPRLLWAHHSKHTSSVLSFQSLHDSNLYVEPRISRTEN